MFEKLKGALIGFVGPRRLIWLAGAGLIALSTYFLGQPVKEIICGPAPLEQGISQGLPLPLPQPESAPK